MRYIRKILNYALKKNNAVLLLSITQEKQLNKILVKLSKKKKSFGLKTSMEKFKPKGEISRNLEASENRGL